ncbi:MAG: PEP-CTERM sorting domain-containing protein [Phycisphaerae bacterium]
MIHHRIGFLVPVLVCTVPAAAQIHEVGPFEGALSEDLDSFPTTMIVSELDLFGGAATLSGVSGDTTVHLLLADTFGGDTVLPRSSPFMVGVTEPAVWAFDTPLLEFGGYFENNSGADDATAEFFDDAGILIDSRTIEIPVDAQSWTWNGWQFDVPVSRIEVTGNGVLGGFIWYDDMELTAVPEPATLGLLLTGIALASRRRR